MGKKKKYRRRTEFETDQLKKQFLELYETDGMSTYRAAKKLDFLRTNIYKWTETDPEFATEYERIKLSKSAEGATAWVKQHEHDQENKKLFLELYADPAASVAGILKQMGCKRNSFSYWKKTDPEFKKNLEELQEISRPRHAKGLKRSRDTRRKGVEERQEHFLNVYRKSLFNITKTCEALELPRTTVMDWIRKDPDFKSALDAMEEERNDFIEGKAMEKIENGDTIMTIFASKCHLADRGWIEKPQQKKVTVEHKHDKAMIDAVVRAAELSQGKYFELPYSEPKQITEQIIDAEYEE